MKMSWGTFAFSPELNYISQENVNFMFRIVKYGRRCAAGRFRIAPCLIRICSAKCRRFSPSCERLGTHGIRGMRRGMRFPSVPNIINAKCIPTTDSCLLGMYTSDRTDLLSTETRLLRVRTGYEVKFAA